MTVRSMAITITILGVVLIIAAYIVRGEWGAGSEWFLFTVTGGLIIGFVPIKEGRSLRRGDKNN